MKDAAEYKLPLPSLSGGMSLSETLRMRHSVRQFAVRPVALETVAQLLWAAQGISSPEGLRTAPSAGGLYPLKLYLVAGEVEGLSPGAFSYEPKRHSLLSEREGDVRSALAGAAINQHWLGRAPAIIVIAADYSVTTSRYGERGIRYVHIDAGHAGENLLLQAVALGLGSTVVGAFRDEGLQEALGLTPEIKPLSVLPVGYPALEKTWLGYE